jgi:hypothetical protein
MLERLRLVWFLGAFAFGMLVCYVSTPRPEVVMKFPTPGNAGQVTYKDRAENCYKIKAESVACPLDKACIRPQPLLEDFSPQTALR